MRVTNQEFYGVTGDDFLWVSLAGSSCGTAADWLVDGGSGADTCGDSDWGWGNFTDCTTQADEWSDISGTCAKQTP